MSKNIDELSEIDKLSAALDEEHGYPKYNIKVDKGFYTVYELKRKFDSDKKRIILDSTFQRKNVWKRPQKAELIESILMGLPLPIFYFNQDKTGALIVIDGRQRLTALFEFMSDSWPLKGLKVVNEFNGFKFSQLPPVIQTLIEDYQIQAHVIQPPTPDVIKFDIFDRVNRAGTQLNKQEIRNALYQGDATELLQRIAASQEFEEATEKAFMKHNRMKDRYILLRYIAFELYFSNQLFKNGQEYEYKNDMDEFLGIAMETINSMGDSQIEAIEKRTLVALQNARLIMGENAFRLIRTDGTRSPINMNVFEVVMHIMQKKGITTQYNRNYIQSRVNDMKKDDKFLDSIGDHRDSKQKILDRFEMADNVLRKA